MYDLIHLQPPFPITIKSVLDQIITILKDSRPIKEVLDTSRRQNSKSSGCRELMINKKNEYKEKDITFISNAFD